MDANALLEVFAGTLNPDRLVFRASESRLQEMLHTPGFLGACLDIIGSLGQLPPQQKGVATAIAVYFKNIIVRNWHKREDVANIIDHDERPVIKERILRVMADADFNVKRQLTPLLRVMIGEASGLKEWPQLLNETGYLLQQVPSTSDLSNLVADPKTYQHLWSPLYTGLISFSEICRKFRWKGNQERSDELDPIIIQVFPHLLSVGNLVVENSELVTELTSEIVKLILKSYKFVTYYDLPAVLQTRDALFTWGEFHGKVINVPTPAYITGNGTSTELNKNLLEFSKCLKWSVVNLYRLFYKHVPKKKSYGDFLSIFMKEFIPHLIPNYLSIIEAWCHGTKWLPQLALYYLLETFSVCVGSKLTWLMLQPYYETLVRHLIFPLVCPTDEILETFEVDPQEYIRFNYDIYEDFASPDMAALGLLVTIVGKRKGCLTPVIQFVYEQLTELQQQPESLDVAKKKEGCLRIIGNISHEVVKPKSEYLDQMEPFLTNLIYPNLTSSFQFLKARTLQVASKFCDLEYKDEKCMALLFSGILAPFTEHDHNSTADETSLPVLLEAALCIEVYINQPQFQEQLGAIILPVMSKLLELTNEIDNDAISVVMQECVEKYSQQLQPFGIDLMAKSVDNFMRLVREIYEASMVDVDDFTGNIDDYDDQTTKITSAMGLLNMIITVLLSFEHLSEVLAKLEEVFMPAVEFVLVHQMDDLFSEVVDLIETAIFIAKVVSPQMWKVFQLLVNNFRDGIALSYLEELSPTIETYIAFGQEQLASGPPELCQGLQFILSTILTSDDLVVGYEDILCGYELSLYFLLAVRDVRRPDVDVGNLISITIASYQRLALEPEHRLRPWFFVQLHNVILAGLIADVSATTRVLEEAKYRQVFFEQWLGQCLSLKRVFDLKLSIMGIITVLTNAEVILPGLPENIQQSLPLLFAQLVNKVPAALVEFARKRKTFGEAEARFQSDDELLFNSYGHQDYEDDDNFDDDDSDGNGDNQGGAETSEASKNNEYIDFLKDEQEKLKQYAAEGLDAAEIEDLEEEEEELEEELFGTTPIDNLDILQITRLYLENLQKSNSEGYNQLIQSMNEGERQGLFGALITS